MKTIDWLYGGAIGFLLIMAIVMFIVMIRKNLDHESKDQLARKQMGDSYIPEQESDLLGYERPFIALPDTYN